jgi:hypothetical protein
MKNTITIDLECGSFIGSVIKEAIALAASKDCNVSFTFNGIELIVNALSIYDDVYNEFNKKREEESQRWRNSPEGIAYFEKDRIDTEKKQRIMDGLMVIASDVWKQNKNWNRKMKWLIDYHSCNIRAVSYNKEEIISIVEMFHEENWGVGEPKEFFNKKENMAKYVIGQWLSMMKKMGCVHDMVGSFAEKALAK